MNSKSLVHPALSAFLHGFPDAFADGFLQVIHQDDEPYLLGWGELGADVILEFLFQFLLLVSLFDELDRKSVV